MNGYELYLKQKENYKQQHDKLLFKINSQESTPQNLLIAKSVGRDIFNNKDAGCYCESMDGGGFGFSEIMVNKLMTLAYSLGCTNIDEQSFTKGYNKAREEMINFLN